MSISAHACLGGTRVREDIRALKGGVQRALNLIDLKVFALDEADKRLSVGFQSQNKILFSFPPDITHVAIISATLLLEVSGSKFWISSASFTWS